MSSRNNKAYFETVGGAAIAAMCVAISTPIDGDYVTRQDIQDSIDLLQNTYNDYLNIMDASYVDITNQTNSFVASSNTQALLQQLVIQTIAGLNSQILNAKQERIINLMQDSQLIVLVHQYMGLDVADKNIETFRQINNIKNNSLFLIEKGTQIKYYV